MLREFRRPDAPGYLRLLVEEFPEESRLLLWRTEGLRAVVDRAFRWDARALQKLLAALGRPVVRFFVIDVDGRVAGAALLTFGALAGEVGSVVVAPEFRRRGFARRLLAACEAGARAAKRRFTVLDVLEANAPARALYDAAGYRPLRRLVVLARDLEGAPPPGPGGPLPPGVRAFRRRDAAALAEAARAALSPEVAAVLPAARADFAVSKVVLRVLRSRSAAWVVDAGSGAAGFLRATVGPSTASGHLTAPLFARGVAVEPARALVRTGVDFLRRHGARRAVTEIPLDRSSALDVVREEGFHEAYRVETLSKPL